MNFNFVLCVFVGAFLSIPPNLCCADAHFGHLFDLGIDRLDAFFHGGRLGLQHAFDLLTLVIDTFSFVLIHLFYYKFIIGPGNGSN